MKRVRWVVDWVIVGAIKQGNWARTFPLRANLEETSYFYVWRGGQSFAFDTPTLDLSSLYKTRRFLREALGSAGAQAPCWGAGHRFFTGSRSRGKPNLLQSIRKAKVTHARGEKTTRRMRIRSQRS